MSRLNALKQITDGAVEAVAVVALAYLGSQGMTDPALIGAIAGIAGYSRKVRGGG